MSIIVAFDNAQLDAMWKAAEQRQQAKNVSVARDKRSDRSLDNVEMHYIGIKGECAVARVLCVPVDLNAYASGDLTKDLTYQGMTIEVKTLQDWLIFNDMSHFGSDVAILVNPCGTETDERIRHKRAHCYRNVAVIGTISRENFARVAFSKDFGYGTRLCVKADQLEPIETFIFRQTHEIDWNARRKRALTWIQTHKTLDGYSFQNEPE